MVIQYLPALWYSQTFQKKEYMIHMHQHNPVIPKQEKNQDGERVNTFCIGRTHNGKMQTLLMAALSNSCWQAGGSSAEDYKGHCGAGAGCAWQPPQSQQPSPHPLLSSVFSHITGRETN